MIKFTILILLLGMTGSCLAEEDDFTSKSNETTTQEVKTLPMPGSLSPGWWGYFAQTGEILERRRQEAQQKYTQLIKQIPDKTLQATAQHHIDKFVGNLQILQELSIAEADYQKESAPDNFKERYSIEEWLTFATYLQSEKIDVDNQTLRFNRERNEVKLIAKRINNLLLAYMEQKGNRDKKLLPGLEMMEARSSNAVREAQLKLDKQTLAAQRIQLNRLLAFSEVITVRLFADQSALQTIEQALQQLAIQQSQIKIHLSQEQSETIGLLGKNPLQRAQARLDDQEVTNALITDAIIMIKIASLNAEKDLAILLLDDKRQPMSVLQESNEQRIKLSAQLKLKVAAWRTDTTNEMSQVQTSILALALDNNSQQLKKIYKQRIKLTQQALADLKQFELERDKLAILITEIENRIAQQSGNLGIMVNWSGNVLGSLKTDVIAWWIEPLFQIGDTPVSAFGLVRVILIIIFASIVSAMFQRLLLRIAERKDMEGSRASALYTVGRLAHYLILLIGIIIALSSIGLDFTNLALVAGALSVGIGFGLQSIVNNFVSGLILLFEGTLKVGDFIEIESGVTGLVKGINVRSTLINTNDNVDMIVPNSVLVSNRVTNWTLREVNRRIHVPFGVAYGTDKNLVKKAVLEAASRVRFTHQSKRGEMVQCWLVNFGENSLDFELVVWINQEAVRKPGTVHAAYMWEIETSLSDYGIEIPFPQRDLHIRSVFGNSTPNNTDAPSE
ncbi:mechanosensitive ion channel family protein [Methyloprofundus sedimenti]|uniref:mechanosensitive ion channel family protein n=1 Tax=Methyloprofundus sedimenti TaxID=1420851 RepID=UPI001301CA65|nr:mechanosensitive ion channel domain-containing protein [Methyloprofundus sedimenti]